MSVSEKVEFYINMLEEALSFQRRTCIRIDAEEDEVARQVVEWIQSVKGIQVETAKDNIMNFLDISVFLEPQFEIPEGGIFRFPEKQTKFWVRTSDQVKTCLTKFVEENTDFETVPWNVMNMLLFLDANVEGDWERWETVNQRSFRFKRYLWTSNFTRDILLAQFQTETEPLVIGNITVASTPTVLKERPVPKLPESPSFVAEHL